MLQLKQLQAGYGASKVLFGVDLDIAARQVVSLIGRNGMGKTTTVKTIMGMLPAQGGSILLDGQPIAGQAPHRIAQLGIGLVPEGRRVFGSLSVEENLIATARNTRAGWHVGRVFDLFPRLKEEGQTILVIDKNLKEMATLVDRHHVLEKGRVVWQGSPAELAAQPELAQRYLGV
jgi:branched-chain amino acid transport system ATP-binding protein